jgi:hypothetical protein
VAWILAAPVVQLGRVGHAVALQPALDIAHALALDVHREYLPDRWGGLRVGQQVVAVRGIDQDFTIRFGQYSYQPHRHFGLHRREDFIFQQSVACDAVFHVLQRDLPGPVLLVFYIQAFCCVLNHCNHISLLAVTGCAADFLKVVRDPGQGLLHSILRVIFVVQDVVGTGEHQVPVSVVQQEELLLFLGCFQGS